MIAGLPSQYQSETEGMIDQLDKKNIRYKQVGLGFGKRTDFTKQPQAEFPGPIYDHHSINSIANISKT